MPAALRSPLLNAFHIVLHCVLMLTAAETVRGAGVSPERALQDAALLTQHFPDWIPFRGAGDSMAPRFDNTHILLVKRAAVEELRAGMIAVFRDSEGDLVAHAVVAVEADGILSKGLNNREPDPALIPAPDIIGVLVGTLAANAPIPGDSGLEAALGKRY